MNVVSLCSGVGLLDLGLEWAGMRTVQVCEIDPWCRGILERRFPDARLHDDAWTIDPVACDVVAAGFPCQPVSVAGKRAGQDDDRWLWPAVERAVRLARPRYVLLENVPGIASLGLGDALRDLAALGFDAEWTVFGAAEVGAIHRRDRFWLVATSDADQSGLWDERGGFFRPGWAGDALDWAHGPTRPVADADGERRREGLGIPTGRRVAWARHPVGAGAGPDEADADALRRGGRTGLPEPAERPEPEVGGRREPIADVGRAPNGGTGRVDGHRRDVPLPARWLDGTWEDGVNRTTTETGNRARRLSALGNGVVPQCVELIGYRIRQLDGAA